MSLSEILEELPKLTEEERRRVQEELDAIHPDHEREWTSIAVERLGELESGSREAIPAEEVFAKARRLISE
jgi:hypothetical protein